MIGFQEKPSGTAFTTSPFPGLMTCVLFLLSCVSAGGAELPLWDDAEVHVNGEFIGGYFDDHALLGSAGRETQLKMSRGIIGLDIQHRSGIGGLLEYNVFPDEVKRDPSDHRTNFDYYNNLGTDLLFYGDFKVRNGYLRYRPGRLWGVRAGRMVNLIGFEDDEVPFWGRYDSPHAHFLNKEILNGVTTLFELSWFRLEGGIFKGRGRPDSDYNWYLKGAADPNVSDNSNWIVEGEATLHWKDYFSLSGGYHGGRTGSAPGDIFSGKHNDFRYVIGTRMQTPDLGFFLNRILLIGEASRYEIGLTENGGQGANTPTKSKDLKKDGWFATLGLSFFRRLWLFGTYEEIDRIDSLVWAEIAQYDESHWCMGDVERSLILQADLRLNQWVVLSGFYRWTDFEFGEISGIWDEVVREKDYDKVGVVLKVNF